MSLVYGKTCFTGEGHSLVGTGQRARFRFGEGDIRDLDALWPCRSFGHLRIPQSALRRELERLRQEAGFRIADDLVRAAVEAVGEDAS